MKISNLEGNMSDKEFYKKYPTMLAFQNDMVKHAMAQFMARPLAWREAHQEDWLTLVDLWVSKREFPLYRVMYDGCVRANA